jgi:glycine oxidase
LNCKVSKRHLIKKGFAILLILWFRVTDQTNIRIISFAYCTIKNRVDHIIVGQGLAGSCLALQLIRQGKKILVFDEPWNNRASAVAAGLFNPITGKFLKQSWAAEKIFPSLFQFYRTAEDLLQQRFFYPMPIYRPFISIEEQNEWMAQSEESLLKKFIAKIYVAQSFSTYVNDPYGGVVTNSSGYLDTVSFMNATRDFLKTRFAYQETFFDLGKLTIQKKEICYQDVVATNIIFCDGLGINANPYFSWIPVIPLKGETLTISLSEEPEVIFNRAVYIVPTQSEKSFMVGATYNPNDNTQKTTAFARNELEEKLKDLINAPFTVSNQNWGMRPTTPDRRPVIGSHPEFKNLLVFNGLGTKGVSLAPYFSGLLASWLDGNEEIPTTVNIERFKSLYSKFSSAII